MPLTSAEILKDPIDSYPEATVACFDPTCGELPRRQLDEARTIEYLERLSSAGAKAALIASSTGQGHLRTVEELEAWFRCAARAETQDMLLFGLLRPEDGIKANYHLLDVLAKLNYPVVFFRPGNNLPENASDAQVSDSLAPLVEAAAARHLAVGLYSISDVSGLPLTPGATAPLVDAPGGDHIVAIKVTETDYSMSTALFLAHPALCHLKIVQGWDPHLEKALRDGPRHDEQGRQRVGITSGLMALAIYQYLHILRLARDSDWDNVRAAQLTTTALFEAMQDDPQHFADLQRAKYLMGLGHPLTSTVSDAQAERVLDVLKEVPSLNDRKLLARSLDLMGNGPFHDRLIEIAQQ